MATNERVVSIHPYFKVADGKMAEFKKLCEQFISATTPEPNCLYYGFSFSGNQVHCREAYDDAEGLLMHLTSVADLLNAATKIAEITRLEIHGSAEELAKLAAPLAHLSPTYFTLEYAIRRAS